MTRLKWWVVGYFVAIGVVLLAPLASGSPDGLERVAEDEGFIGRAEDAPYSVIADYVFPGIDNKAVATILGGIAGVTVVYALVAGLALIYMRKARGRVST